MASFLVTLKSRASLIYVLGARKRLAGSPSVCVELGELRSLGGTLPLSPAAIQAALSSWTWMDAQTSSLATLTQLTQITAKSGVR